MRIIAGEFKRRRLLSPPEGSTTRPIPDRVKVSLFNLLRGHFDGVAVFDAFAGTGAIGLEAVSRGAARCVLVERDKRVAATLKANIEALGAQDRCEVVVGDALGYAAALRCPVGVHLVFFDPPYAMMEDAARRPRVMAQLGRCIERLDETGYAILRTPWPLRAPASEGGGDADLTIPGAQGPETHVYASMGVHLYMRSGGGPGEREESVETSPEDSSLRGSGQYQGEA